MDTTRADERDQDCEVLFRTNKQSSNIAGGAHVGKDDLDDSGGLHHARGETGVTTGHVDDTGGSLEPRKIDTVVTQMVNVPVVMKRAAAAQDRNIQQRNNKPQQPAKQTMQERETGRREEEEKGREEREKGGKGSCGRRGQGGREGRDGLDSGCGRNEDSHGGCVARRQSTEDPEYCEWK